MEESVSAGILSETSLQVDTPPVTDLQYSSAATSAAHGTSLHDVQSLASQDKSMNTEGVASHDKPGNAEGVASHDKPGNAEGVASHDKSENAEGVASHDKSGNAEGVASHDKPGNADGVASQDKGNAEGVASHDKSGNAEGGASQDKFLNTEGVASHGKSGNAEGGASQDKFLNAEGVASAENSRNAEGAASSHAVSGSWDGLLSPAEDAPPSTKVTGERKKGTASETNETREAYVARQIKALDFEREEEFTKWKATRLESTILEKQGFAFRNLRVASISIGAFGSIIIRFTPPNRTKLAANHIAVGDVVAINASVDGNYMYDSTAFEYCDSWGHVEVIADSMVTVSAENFKPMEPNKDCQYLIRKLPNNLMYSRMKSGISRLLKFPDEAGYVMDLLFGDQVPTEVPIHPSLVDPNGELQMKNTSLSVTQIAAIEFALRQKSLAVIHGPPGTGKSTTLAELIFQLSQAGERVLVCAPTNVAVDNLMSKCIQYEMKMVRLGHPTRVNSLHLYYTADMYLGTNLQARPLREAKLELRKILIKLMGPCGRQEAIDLSESLREHRKEIQRREKKLAREGLLGVSVCFATLGSAHKDNLKRFFPEKFFTTLIIDEASQALDAACWLVIPSAKRCILAGDHFQLPPVVLSMKAKDLSLEYTLMERAIGKFNASIHSVLARQYRMNEDIMAWSSERMYKSGLLADGSVAAHLLCNLPGVITTEETELSLLLIDTSGCRLGEHRSHLSYGNSGEADIVAFIAGELVTAGVNQHEIGVITPYKRQVDCVKASMKSLTLFGVEVKTVDGFQGREKEAIILSLVRSNPGGEIGFLADDRRMNVAVTRSRRFLCVVTDVSTVSQDPMCESLIKHMITYGDVRSAHEYSDAVTATKIPDDPGYEAVPKRKKKVGVPREWSEDFPSSSDDSDEVRRLRVVDEDSLLVEVNGTTCAFDKLRLIEDTAVGMRRKKKGQQKSGQAVPEAKCRKFGKYLDVQHLRACLGSFVCGDQREIKIRVDITQMEARCIERTAAEMNLLVSHVQEKGVTTSLVFKKIPGHNPGAELGVVTSKFHIVGVGEGLLPTPADDTGLWDDLYDVNPASGVGVPESDDIVPEPTVIPVEKKGRKRAKKRVVKGDAAEGVDESDAYLDEVIKTVGICATANCKVSVRLIGSDCQFCRQRYCIPHTLPEIHGCTEQAKRAARKAFLKPSPRPLTQDKKAALKKCMERKLTEMSSTRKGR